MTVELDLGFVEVDTNTGHFDIEHIWVGSEDLWGKTAEELIIACVGGKEELQALMMKKASLEWEERGRKE